MLQCQEPDLTHLGLTARAHLHGRASNTCLDRTMCSVGLSVKTKWQSSRNPACCDVLKSVPAFTTNLPVIIINTHGQKLEDTKNEVSDAELCTCGAPSKGGKVCTVMALPVLLIGTYAQ